MIPVARWTVPFLLVAASCASEPVRRAPPTPAPTPVAAPPTEPATPVVDLCPERLLKTHGIDVTPEPRVCAPLEAAIDGLTPLQRLDVKRLRVVRDVRGPCADACPDLATQLMSDGALAYYTFARHELHVPDAFFDGPRWRSPAPTAEAMRGYLDGLGLADWGALVQRLRARACVSLPADVPEGAPVVWEQIVKCGAPVLLGGDVDKAALLRHELGHALLARGAGAAGRIKQWASLSQWRDADGGPADGLVQGFIASEHPIVASRLLLGLERGAGPLYTPQGGGFVTGYASFDPLEDHAESLRLAASDPEKLGEVAPGKLLFFAPNLLDLEASRLSRFIAPGVRALLAPTTDARLAAATLRELAPALDKHLDQIRELADARPIEPPPGTHPDVAEKLANAELAVKVGDVVLRPHDDAIKALVAEWEAARKR